MRSSALAATFAILVSASGAYAQDQPPKPKEDPQQKPPAAVGEEGKKPVRSFPSALIHNLGDDVKHMPRKNSLDCLAGGSALALVVHPNDNKLNRRLEGSGA